jgi:ribosome-binding factor A
MASAHHAQAESVIRRTLQEILIRGLSDPRVRGLLSVTRVTLSPDGADATVYVSVLPQEHAEMTLHGLRHAAKFLRTQLGTRVQMRRLPRLAFRLDEALKIEARTLAAIAEANAQAGRGAEPEEGRQENEAS